MLNIERLLKNAPPSDEKAAQLIGALARELHKQGLLSEEWAEYTDSGKTPAARREDVRTPLSAETQILIEHLRRHGYVVYDLVGKTPRALRSEGMYFSQVNPALEKVSTPSSLVAFKLKPEAFFLKGSQNIPYEKQLELLEKEKAKIVKQYPDTGLVVRVGKPTEWTEASWNHFQATEVKLFGENFGYKHTWTDTYESDQPGARRVVVDVWRERNGSNGMFISFCPPDLVLPNLRLAALIEIPRK